MKVGFAKDGRITALDMFVVSENGPYEPVRATTAQTGRIVSLLYQPEAMRWRGRLGADQHAAAARAEPAGRHAGHHADGAGSREGGAQARRRSGRDPPHQRAGGQGEVRSAEPARRTRATPTSAFVKEALDQWRGAVPVGRAQGAERQAPGSKVTRRRRGGEHVRRRARSASTACSSSSRTAGCTSSPASATSAPSR